jgi:hypothetical protein
MTIGDYVLTPADSLHVDGDCLTEIARNDVADAVCEIKLVELDVWDDESLTVSGDLPTVPGDCS